MEILGIGLSEIFFILLLVLVLINPKDMKATGLTIGRFLRRVVTSPLWQELRNVWAGITNLPYQLMREANLEDLRQTGNELKNSISPQQPTTFLPHPKVNTAPTLKQATQYGSWSEPSTMPPAPNAALKSSSTQTTPPPIAPQTPAE